MILMGGHTLLSIVVICLEMKKLSKMTYLLILHSPLLLILHPPLPIITAAIGLTARAVAKDIAPLGALIATPMPMPTRTWQPTLRSKTTSGSTTMRWCARAATSNTPGTV